MTFEIIESQAGAPRLVLATEGGETHALAVGMPLSLPRGRAKIVLA